MSAKGQGNLVRVLRLSRPTLAASADHQPDRIDLRDCSFTDLSHQGLGFSYRHLNDGVQTRSGSTETLAPATRLPTHSQSHYRRPIRRWRRSNSTSRLTCYQFRMRLPLIHNF